MSEQPTADQKALIKRLKFELKECRSVLAVELQRGYRNGYNDARREVTNKLRELLGMDPL